MSIGQASSFTLQGSEVWTTEFMYVLLELLFMDILCLENSYSVIHSLFMHCLEGEAYPTSLFTSQLA